MQSSAVRGNFGCSLPQRARRRRVLNNHFFLFDKKYDKNKLRGICTFTCANKFYTAGIDAETVGNRFIQTLLFIKKIGQKK